MHNTPLRTAAFIAADTVPFVDSYNGTVAALHPQCNVHQRHVRLAQQAKDGLHLILSEVFSLGSVHSMSLIRYKNVDASGRCPRRQELRSHKRTNQ